MWKSVIAFIFIVFIFIIGGLFWYRQGGNAVSSTYAVSSTSADSSTGGPRLPSISQSFAAKNESASVASVLSGLLNKDDTVSIMSQKSDLHNIIVDRISELQNCLTDVEIK